MNPFVVPDSAVPWFQRHRFSRKQKTKSDYVASLLEDFQHIKPFLPAQVDTILDIGCGLAGIDVLLIKGVYPDARLWLLDGNGDDPCDGWNPGGLGAFNSRAATTELLTANGVTIDAWFDVGTKEHLKADLVISLASWGYHYPLSTYNVSGLCIADLRKSVQAARGKIIKEYPKRNLCVWVQEGK